MKITQLFSIGILCLMSLAPIVEASEVPAAINSQDASKTHQNPMPIATNLQTLGQEAIKQNLPIAILFSGKGLKSTEKIKDLALYPALLSGQLDGHVLFTEIEVNIDADTIDFYGEAMANKEYKALYNLTSLPVVIFVNGEGNALTDPLLSGAYDYYFFYLKQSINHALKALNNPNLIPE